MCQLWEPVPGIHQLYTISIIPQWHCPYWHCPSFQTFIGTKKVNLFDLVWFLGEGVWLHGKESQPMQETQVRSLGWVDSLEEEMATHSSILAKKIPWTEEPDGLQSVGSQSMVRHSRAHTGGGGRPPWFLSHPHTPSCAEEKDVPEGGGIQTPGFPCWLSPWH